MNSLTMQLQPLTCGDFETVRQLARSACGISLHEEKRALVSSRLEKLVRRNGCESFREYIELVSKRRNGLEFTEFIDTLTTNHSGFWREPEHFLFLRNTVFPAHSGRVRIWSSACATGEEPYTIAMCAKESGVPNFGINASDISTAALSVAMRGEYEDAKTKPLPAGWRQKYFNNSPSGAPGVYAAIPALRSTVSFASLNLLQPFGHVGQFDVIFCRNVMIYFEQATRDQLVENLVRQLHPGGYLFTGHSETLLRLPETLQYIQPATYRKL
jgi:chemotaxis protein methyltransferase CheR